MELFLKEVSATEEDQHCQPSFDRFSEGRLPLRNSDQLGCHANPCWSKSETVFESSERLPCSECAPFAKVCSTISAMAGFLFSIMGNASAHDAQYAALTKRAADLNPRPPMRIERVANCCARSCSAAVP